MSAFIFGFLSRCISLFFTNGSNRVVEVIRKSSEVWQNSNWWNYQIFKAVESKDNTGWVIHVVNGIKKHHNVTSQTQYQQTQKH